LSTIYKISGTRGIAHTSNYDIDIYQGSSFNRKAPKVAEKTETKTGFVINEYGVYEEEFNYDNRQINFDKGGINESTKDGQLLPLDGVPFQRKHKLSGRSKDKIKNKIQSLYRACPSSKFTFLTLTFINDVSHKDAKQCLNKFLTVLRKRYGKFMYLWVAEKQPENNNRIHFHFVLDRRFIIPQLNALWVLQQYNSGITLPEYDIAEIRERYLKSMLVTGLNYDKAGTMQEILNPFDIKKVNSIEGLAIYLTMYITKNNDEFDCANWHCCRQFSKLFTTQIISVNQFGELEDLSKNYSVNTNTGEVYEARTYLSDYAYIVTVQNKRYFSKYLNGVDDLNRWILAGMGKAKVPQITYNDYEFIYNNKTPKKGTTTFKQISKNFTSGQTYSCTNTALTHELISSLCLTRNSN
jgi:hypothetical protein